MDARTMQKGRRGSKLYSLRQNHRPAAP